MRSESEQVLALEQRVQQLTEALRREERISRALREVGSALGSTLDLDALLELILNKLTDLVEADRSTLYLLDESTRELVSRLVVGEQVRSIRMRVGHGLAGTVALTGKPIRVSRAYEDPRFEREWDLLTGYRTESMLAAPLKNHLGRTIGVIQVLNKREGGEFTDEDEAILSSLSMQAAVAIDNSRLFLSLIQKNKQLSDTTEQLERRVRDLSLLFELERATARATTIEDLVHACLHRVVDASDARAAALVLAAEETGDLVAHLYQPGREPELERIGVKSGEGVPGRVMVTGQPVSGPDFARHASPSPRVEGHFSFPITRVLSVPLDGDAGALGALALYNKRDDTEFSDEDFAIVRLVAANMSTAVRLFNASSAREREERLSAIGRLLSQVTHDFRSPMTVISGYVQLMAEADDRAKRLEYSEEILRQFDILTAMQREVLEFARGERTIFVRKVLLRKFFADLSRQIELEIGERPIELVVSVDSKLVARFDESRVARAIHNLARNAIEAMGARGGRLTIEARMENLVLVIRVRDTGPGIPKEIEGRLFQSFVTAGKRGGTGLGLAIVRKIAEEHGGSVTVSSSPEGATFELRLPQKAPVGSSPERAGKRARPSTRPAAPKSQ
ncbi:MAG TPA: GAF domain-containing protein [Polyangiaceae bacterium]|nr:GAF domain-containing protein [Polyangiaceae bacterium]